MEAARVVRPGGKIVVLDLRAHTEGWVREKLGDRWLGFADEELERLLTSAGLTGVKVGVGSRGSGDPFTVLVASGTRRAPRAKFDPAALTSLHEGSGGAPELQRKRKKR
jgi:hypothetical protein